MVKRIDKQLIVSIDIGAQAVRIVVGRIVQQNNEENETFERKMQVLGTGKALWPAETFERDKLISEGNFQKTIEKAIIQATYQSCTPITEKDSIIVTLSGPSVIGVTTEGLWPIMPYTISAEDLQNLSPEERQLEKINNTKILREEELIYAQNFAQHQALSLFPNFYEIHREILNIAVDNRNFEKDDFFTLPTGKLLNIKMHFIMLNQNYTSQILPAIAKSFLRTSINGDSFSCLALSLAVCNEQELNGEILIINLGYNSTQYVYWKNSCVHHSGQINVGLQHFINDLFVAFQFKKFEDAETFFNHLSSYGSFIREDDGPSRVVNSEFPYQMKYNVYMSDVELILTARLKELMSILLEKIKSDEKSNTLSPVMKIRLCGEGATLPKIAEFIQTTTQIPTTTQFTLSSDLIFNSDTIKETLNHPEWGCAVGGLLYKEYNKPVECDIAFDVSYETKKIFNKIKDSICQKIPFITQS